jgi:bacterioferritin-associated ferredoxin
MDVVSRKARLEAKACKQQWFALPSRSMIVCICHRVSDRDIASAVARGCASFDELQFETGVATQCGACHGCAVETFEQHACTGRAAGHCRVADVVTLGGELSAA